MHPEGAADILRGDCRPFHYSGKLGRKIVYNFPSVASLADEIHGSRPAASGNPASEGGDLHWSEALTGNCESVQLMKVLKNNYV